MFQGHPKGLYVLFFTEMWERFGFYTMVAIFVFYLGAAFGWDSQQVTNVWGIFMAAVYFTPIIGGWIADNYLGYGRTIVIGAITLGIGYALLAIPTNSLTQLYIALAVVAIGNGLFKANISVMVGNLYAHKDGSLKDAGFNIFYMGINIGAFYAPQAAAGIRNYFQNDLGTSLAVAYNAGFGIAAIGMVISLLIFVLFRKYYADADYQSKHAVNSVKDVVLTPTQERERIIALVTIFTIVIFFWMAFHQNGAALSLYAQNYTDSVVGPFTAVLFNIVGLHAVIAFFIGIGLAFSKSSSSRSKGIGWALLAGGSAVILYQALNNEPLTSISPEQFISFNAMFIVLMTPLIVAIFRWMNGKGIEPSSPAKIGIGMLVTGIAFLLMMAASFSLPPVHSLNGQPSPVTVTPYFLISTYFILTIAELFLSPMGLSFVSKVAPARMKGLMMGGWFMATAIGNYLSGFVGRFYQNWELWQFFLLLVVTSLVSALLVLFFLKKLKAATE
ncbi:MAG: peptide MFS transporter [Bacteroidetes bacterium]|nr:peptide MFS transporter [Bacteroidota bacterium]